MTCHACPRCGRVRGVVVDGELLPHDRPTHTTVSGWRPCVAVVMKRVGGTGGVVRLTRTGGGPYRGGGSTDGGAA